MLGVACIKQSRCQLWERWKASGALAPGGPPFSIVSADLQVLSYLSVCDTQM